jgi:uncharacterized protein
MQALLAATIPPNSTLYSQQMPNKPLPISGNTMDNATSTKLIDADFQLLDSILDDIRSRMEETPSWEFCEGFMAALLVCRNLIPASQYLPVLLDLDGPESLGGISTEAVKEPSCFSSAEQLTTFMSLWQRRWNEIATALIQDPDSAHEAEMYVPYLLDMRGAIAALPVEEREDIDPNQLSAFAQIWAVGFMYAVESWPHTWAPPKNKKVAGYMDQALQSIIALTEDTAPNIPTTSLQEKPESVGRPAYTGDYESRSDAFYQAINAVYDLHAIGRHLGPTNTQIRQTPQPGRNEACFCGSGKKFKKCHGA